MCALLMQLHSSNRRNCFILVRWEDCKWNKWNSRAKIIAAVVLWCWIVYGWYGRLLLYIYCYGIADVASISPFCILNANEPNIFHHTIITNKNEPFQWHLHKSNSTPLQEMNNETRKMQFFFCFQIQRISTEILLFSFIIEGYS